MRERRDASTAALLHDPDGGPRRPGPMMAAFVAIIVLSATASLTTALVLEIQAGSSAYVVGEGHWSRAHQDSVGFLHAYALDGDASHLERSRTALDVIKGDRQARLALDARPVDLAAAREGFLRGGNAPRDIHRLIWMYRLFSGAPYFGEAVEYWREAEALVLELEPLAARIEQAHREGADMDPLIEHLLALDARIRPLERAFSETLLSGKRWMHVVLVAVSVVVFATLALIASWAFFWALRRIKRSEGRFRAAFRQSAVGMATLDTRGRILEANRAFLDMLGLAEAAWAGTRLADLAGNPVLQRALSADPVDWSAFSRPGEHPFRRADDSLIWLRWVAVQVETARDQDVFVVIEDVSDARRMAERLRYQASHDALTGLANRRELEVRLEQALKSARSEGRRHCLCFIDLDHFKQVNDQCGHMAGDRLLRRVAAELGQPLRADDILGRLGGDEFAVLLPDTALEDGLVVAERLRSRMSKMAFRELDREFGLGASVGLVEINQESVDVGSALAAADAACYEAKARGRNRVHVHGVRAPHPGGGCSDMERLVELRSAIEEGRLRLYAQGMESAVHGAGLTYEVLSRIDDAQGSPQLPGPFFMAAERFSQAGMVDRHVIAQVLATLGADPRLRAATRRCMVNLSVQSLSDESFAGFLEQSINESGVPPELLCFELTETAVMQSLAVAQAFIERVRGLGCQVALDDFGSGQSSFSYLKHLPVDVLKIDGELVKGVASEPLDRALVEGMCGIGRALGKQVVVEWVEDDAAADWLRGLGVDFLQGFAIHRPCPIGRLVDEEVPLARGATARERSAS